jgi:hypothetical protein
MLSSECGDDQQPLGPLDGHNASYLFARSVTVHADLPIAVLVHERSLDDCSSSQASLYLDSRDSPFRLAFSAVPDNNDSAAIRGQLSNHPERARAGDRRLSH